MAEKVSDLGRHSNSQRIINRPTLSVLYGLNNFMKGNITMQKKFLRTFAICGSFIALQLFDATNVSLAMAEDDELMYLMKSRHARNIDGRCPGVQPPNLLCVPCKKVEARIAVLQAERSKEATLRAQLLQAKIDALKKK